MADPKDYTFFTNLAGHVAEAADEQCRKELNIAGIDVTALPEFVRQKGEVKTIIIGSCAGWTFTRAWRYWVADGPGIPVVEATNLYERHGNVTRVDGHAGCLSPLEHFKGLGTGSYHVDAQEGLTALRDMLSLVVRLHGPTVHIMEPTEGHEDDDPNSTIEGADPDGLSPFIGDD